MVNFGKTRSTVKPDAIVIDEFSVWQHTNITPVSENVGEENEFVGFEYDMVQYEKNEFIMQNEDGEELARLILEAQNAGIDVVLTVRD